MNKLLKIIAVISIALILLLVLVFTVVDRTPLAETLYYSEGLEKVHNINLGQFVSNDTIKVGWSKVSLVPDKSTPMAGYGKRKGAHFQGVDDTVFVRTYVFEQASTKAAYITVDLLIFPPLVYQKVLERSKAIGFDEQNLFLTASHTHSSIGGWQPGLVGKLFSGDFDEAVIDFIADKILESIHLATSVTEKAKLGFMAIEAGNLVTNRLVGDQLGTIDPWFRYIKIIKESGETAYLCSYSAHATCFGGAQLNLSGDYPGKLVQILEADTAVEFASYGAGAVGSMKPLVPPMEQNMQVEYIANKLAGDVLFLNSLTPMEYITDISFARFDVPLREPHFRVSDNIRVRPWVFKKLFGEVSPTINMLKLGEIILVGTPADFSGELIYPIDSTYKANGQYLMLHSFNGSYIGYVTHDKWYDMGKYETETMGWFGPYNGHYFSELILTLGEKAKAK